MSNPTTPFSWQMPTATDLVTDLPADFEVFGQAVATSMQYLLGGTTGQILSKTSATNMAFTWVNNDQGDITEVAAGTGITVTSGTGPIATVALTTPVSVANGGTGIASFGTGIATFLGTPSSANLAAALTDETGTGVVVFATSPTIASPTFTTTATTPNLVVTGSTVPANGVYLPAANTLGLATNTTVRMQINSSGEAGLGGAAIAGNTLSIRRASTGATSTFGINSTETAQTDVTSLYAAYQAQPRSVASAFTLTTIASYQSVDIVKGAGSTVSNHIHFFVNSTTGSADNVYAFRSNLNAATNFWNIYMLGTAANYFAGQTTVGSTSLTLGAGSVAQQFGVVSSAAANIVEVIRGAASQTGDLAQWQNSAGTVLAKVAASGNIVAGNMAIATSSVSTIHISNGTIPSANPVAGGVVYVEAGALKYRGSSGTITTLGAA